MKMQRQNQIFNQKIQRLLQIRTRLRAMIEKEMQVELLPDHHKLFRSVEYRRLRVEFNLLVADCLLIVRTRKWLMASEEGLSYPAL